MEAAERPDLYREYVRELMGSWLGGAARGQTTFRLQSRASRSGSRWGEAPSLESRDLPTTTASARLCLP
jgi:hypothetical protein